MSSDVRDSVSFGRISSEDALNQTLHTFTNERRSLKLTLKNLLVQHTRVLVFEREIAAYKSIENNPCAPYVHKSAFILLPIDHLRSSVTRRPTGRLKQFPILESVR
jgi:hypothetical protein